MALRFYICDVIGTGSDSDPFRPALADLVSSQWIATDGRANPGNATGRMLAQSDVTNGAHATLIADSRITYLQFENGSGPLPLTDPISSIPTARRNQIQTILENHHVPLQDLQLSDSIRSVLRRIVQRMLLRQILGADDFTEALDNLVSSIPTAKRNRIGNRLNSLGFDASVIVGSDTIREALRKLRIQTVNANRTHFD